MENTLKIQVKIKKHGLQKILIDGRCHISKLPNCERIFQALINMSVNECISMKNTKNLIMTQHSIKQVFRFIKIGKNTKKRHYITRRILNSNGIMSGFYVWRLK